MVSTSQLVLVWPSVADAVLLLAVVLALLLGVDAAWPLAADGVLLLAADAEWLLQLASAPVWEQVSRWAVVLALVLVSVSVLVSVLERESPWE